MQTEFGSLIKIRLRNRTIDILPFWSVASAAALALLLLAAALVLEKNVFPRMERARMLPSLRWDRETEAIKAHNRGNDLSDDPVWRSKGFPVSVERTRAHRILVMGDSFAWGAALDNINDVWWRQLQRELERRGYHDVEVIAACAAGASTRDELGFARAVVPRYKPDLMIWGYVTNDPDEHLVPPTMTPVRADKGIADLEIKRLLNFVAPTFPMVADRAGRHRAQKRMFLAANPVEGLEYGDRELALLEGTNFVRYRQTLHEVAQFQRETATPAFFMTLPNFPSNDYFRPRYAPLPDAMRAASLPFYDTLPSFVARYGEPPILRFAATPADGHPGPISTHFFAQSAADILERSYRQVLGAKTTAPVNAIEVNDWVPFDLAVTRETDAIVFDYPNTTDSMLRMPSDEPFLQFNLARPVRLVGVRVEGKYVTSSRVQWTTIDPKMGFDLREPKTPAPGEFVNTIRVSADFLDEKKMPKLVTEEKLSAPFQKEAGFTWSVALPHLESGTDSNDFPTRSVVRLLENSQEIGKPHSQHVDIQNKGGGLYSHWRTRVYFSTPDNSDPNTNGRQYAIRMVVLPEDARRVRVTFVRGGAAR